MNRIRSRWNEGEAAVCGWLQLPGTLHAEVLARLGFDGIVVDLQHSPIDLVSAAPMLMAIEFAGAEPMVRLQANVAADAMKLADLGAYGIISPLIESAADAETLVAALRYPPQGIRSFGPRRPPMRYGPGYAAMAHETIVTMAMIETTAGLDNLEDILAVEGLDGVFIGPTDLALALGREPRVDSDDPVLVATIADILKASRAAGKHAGLFCGGGAFAAARLTDGFDLVSIAPDLASMTEQVRRQLAAVRPG